MMKLNLLQKLFLWVAAPLVYVAGSFASMDMEEGNSIHLPSEIMGEVFSYLDCQELRYVAPVCKEWQSYQGACYERWVRDGICSSHLKLPKGALNAAVERVLTQDGVVMVPVGFACPSGGRVLHPDDIFGAPEVAVSMYNILFSKNLIHSEVSECYLKDDLSCLVASLPCDQVFYKKDEGGGMSHVFMYLTKYIKNLVASEKAPIRFTPNISLRDSPQARTIILMCNESRYSYKDYLELIFGDNPECRLHVVIGGNSNFGGEDLFLSRGFNISQRLFPSNVRHLIFSDPCQLTTYISDNFLMRYYCLSSIEFKGLWRLRWIGQNYLTHCTNLESHRAPWSREDASMGTGHMQGCTKLLAPAHERG